MTLVIGNYSLLYDKPHNKIVISLPQTPETPTNTISPVENRRIDVDEKELGAILAFAKTCFEEERSTAEKGELKC